MKKTFTLFKTLGLLFLMMISFQSFSQDKELIGKIKGFDKYSVVLEANNQEQLIFKHAISTVTTTKAMAAPPASAGADKT